jgi:hypothetical protein
MDYSKVIRQVGEIWTDGNGETVPRKWVPDWEKVQERKVNAIFTIAKAAYEQLYNKKKEIKKHAEQLIREYYKYHKLDQEQKSFTFYNFSRTLMVEVDNSNSLEYDKNLIEQASIHFKDYLDDQMGKIDPALKEVLEAMILDVRREKMNVGTVKKLEHLGRKVDHPEMDKAMSLIDQAKGRGLSRVYYRVRVKNPDDNSYDMIDINFSAIEV